METWVLEMTRTSWQNSCAMKWCSIHLNKSSNLVVICSKAFDGLSEQLIWLEITKPGIFG
jgi:hypothetical protein